MDRNSKLITTQLPDQEKVTLMTFAGRHYFLTEVGCVLSGISAVIGLIPYLCMWNVVKLAMTGWPDRIDGSALVYWGWMTVISSLISMLIYFGALICTHLSAFRTARSMKTVAPHYLIRLPVGYFKQRDSGKLRCTIDDGAGQTEAYPAHQLPSLIGALVAPAAVLMLFLVFDWRFELINPVPMTVGVFFLSRMMRPRIAECMGRYQNALEDMSNKVVEYVRGIPMVRTFQQSIFSFKNFHDSILHYRDWAVSYAVSLYILMCAYTVSINGIFALLIPTSILFAGDISGGAAYEIIALDLLFYILFTSICVPMMNKIIWTNENTIVARDAINRILDIIKEKPLPEPTVATTPSGYTVEPGDVSFSYNNTGTGTLSHVFLTIPQGATAAMVGASGSGKITLVSLIPRFFGVDRGSIRVGGVDVREIGSEELMKLMSFIFQNYHLFKGNLLNNIRAARPQTTEEGMMQVVAAARCEDVIEKMLQGLDIVAGAKDTYLSGGEVQRIVLARAILKDTPIVLLDETTTFTDPDDEYLIQQAFETLVKGKTTIMIAHRLSTAYHSDRAFILEQGRIVEQGRHEELLRSEGLYTKMWKDYQTSMEWKVGGEV